MTALEIPNSNFKTAPVILVFSSDSTCGQQSFTIFNLTYMFCPVVIHVYQFTPPTLEEIAQQTTPEESSEKLSNSRRGGPYHCEHCFKEFAYKSAYLSHEVIHTGAKKYRCSVCSTAFAHKSTLKVHLRTHSREKPYKCTICDAAFPHKPSLSRHLRTHTGEKPFVCEHCSRAFRDQSTLARHYRIHTGERPFKCNQCGKRFSQKSHCTRHMEVKHQYV